MCKLHFVAASHSYRLVPKDGLDTEQLVLVVLFFLSTLS